MRLMKRLEALESARGANDFTHLSDEELEARLREVEVQLAAAGFPLSPEWWEAYERGEVRAMQHIVEELECEILAEG